MNEKLFHEIERLRFLEPDLYVWFEERAAIMQFDGGLSREEAEREALHLARQKKASERTLRREAWEAEEKGSTSSVSSMRLPKAEYEGFF